jgi:hypothetical protein
MTDLPSSPKPATLPVLPRAGALYDLQLMNNLIRTIQAITDILGNPSLAKAGAGFYSGLPQRGAGLRVGYLFSHDGYVRIVRDNDVFSDSFPVTVRIGTVTVTT